MRTHFRKGIAALTRGTSWGHGPGGCSPFSTKTVNFHHSSHYTKEIFVPATGRELQDNPNQTPCPHLGNPFGVLTCCWPRLPGRASSSAGAHRQLPAPGARVLPQPPCCRLLPQQAQLPPGGELKNYCQLATAVWILDLRRPYLAAPPEENHLPC